MGKHKSIVTKYENFSAFSGSPKQCEHHLLFGRGIRQLADDDGIWIPLLDEEHNASKKGIKFQVHENPAAEKLSKMCGQLAWERKYLADKLASDENLGHQSSDDWMDEAREAFRQRYGESWL
jgi:hypothetical protein